MVKIETAPMGS
jgi:hypothetical protein